MRRSTVLSLPLKLVFRALLYLGWNPAKKGYGRLNQSMLGLYTLGAFTIAAAYFTVVNVF
jgi:hypothetical protein